MLRQRDFRPAITPPSSISSGTKVLLIEDHDASRQLARAMLFALGLRNVVEAENGRSGIAAVQNGSFDLVICDWMMPEVTGLEVLKAVRQLYPALPFIMLTALNEANVVRAAKDAGVSAYLVKPISLNELQAKVNAALTWSSRLVEASRLPDRAQRAEVGQRPAGPMILSVSEGNEQLATLSGRFAIERRLTSRVLGRWRELAAGAQPIPRRSLVTAANFGADWGSCFLLGLCHPKGEGDVAVFMHVGEDVSQFTAEGSTLLGRSLTEVLTSEAEVLVGETLQHLGIALRRRSPVNYGGELQFNGRSILFRSILLPLVDDAGHINAVLGAISGRRASE